MSGFDRGAVAVKGILEMLQPDASDCVSSVFFLFGNFEVLH